MSTDGQGRLVRAGCACGWEVIGTEDEVVAAVLDHGERIHNMHGTREQALAGIQPVEPAEAVEEAG